MNQEDAESLCRSRGTGIFKNDKSTRLYFLRPGNITRLGPIDSDSTIYYLDVNNDLVSTRLEPRQRWVSPSNPWRVYIEDEGSKMKGYEVQARMVELETSFRARFECEPDDILHVNHWGDAWFARDMGNGSIIYYLAVVAVREVLPRRPT